MEHYTALSPYLKRRFGCKVYKLSLNDIVRIYHFLETA